MGKIPHIRHPILALADMLWGAYSGDYILENINHALTKLSLFGEQERLKHRNTLGCLDQYVAQNSKYARPPIPSQPPTQKVFFQWHTQYDPTMKHSHCETVYAKELFRWPFFELAPSLRIISILATYKLAGLIKECQWCT